MRWKRIRWLMQCEAALCVGRARSAARLGRRRYHMAIRVLEAPCVVRDGSTVSLLAKRSSTGSSCCRKHLQQLGWVANEAIARTTAGVDGRRLLRKAILHGRRQLFE